MKSDWRIEAPQIAILVAMFLLAALTWNSAPEQIPVHWNIRGEVDRYGGRFEGLLLPPLIGAGLYALLRLAPRIDPGRANYPGFAATYNLVRITLLLMLGGLYGVMHLAMRGRDVSMNTVVPVLVGVVFIVIGGSMGKLRPNWFIGIRTPWTLSSKRAWVRTHRLGGWLFILQGLALAVVVPLTDQALTMGIVVGGVVAIALWAMVYSYIVWRQDPDKVPPAGTLPAE